VSVQQSSSRRPSRRELSHRRADAIDGAAAVFAAKGFHDAQMTEIAAAAELSLASLYSLFRGKEELYRDVLRTATQRMLGTVQDAVAGIDDPAEALLAVIDTLFACFEDMRDLTRMVLSGTQGLPWRMREELGSASRDVTVAFMEWLIGLAREAQRSGQLEGIEPEVFARTLVAAVASAAASVAGGEPGRPFTAASPQVRAIFARVLRSTALV
jgi:AcrR family transcriptional regulator